MFFKKLVTGSTYNKYFPDHQIPKTTFPPNCKYKTRVYKKHKTRTKHILYGPNFMKGKE